jgi:hypothetical protein
MIELFVWLGLAVALWYVRGGDEFAGILLLLLNIWLGLVPEFL